MTAWFRRNRWWLVALPVAVALVLVASAYRLKPYWWDAPDGQRVRATAEVGDWLRWTSTAEEFGQIYEYDFRVRLLAVEPVEDEVTLDYESVPVPDGSDAWSVEIEVEPLKPMETVPCSLVLVATDGERFGGRGRQSQLPCFGAQDGETGRDARFTTTTVIVGAEGAELTEVWLTMADPERLVFRLP